MKKLITAFAAAFLLVLGGSSTAMAGGKYEPLSVAVPVSGEGTFVLEAVYPGTPAADPSELTVSGSGAWEITFTEPGEYIYQAYAKSVPEDVRTVSIYVENDADEEFRLRSSIVVGQNGAKTSTDFTPTPTPAPTGKVTATPTPSAKITATPVPSSNKTTASAGTSPKTGDPGTAAYAVSAAAAAMALFILSALNHHKREG